MAYEDVDVVVIGSGAAGGMAAWNLTRKGAKVLLLEAGQKFNRADFWTHVTPWEGRQRRRRGEKPLDFYGTAERESPYETPQRRPFNLQRVWGVGGKTNVWGRVSLRYSPLNLTEPSRDGWEIPWPLSYEEIAPYYDNVEKRIGINGGDDESKYLPRSENYLPPPNLRCGEALLKKSVKRLGYPVLRGRRATLTQAYNGHAKCHYCGNCGAGCDVGAFFNSSDYLLNEAMETGLLEIIENAVVARILVDDEGLANGVQYFDRLSGEERQVPAKRVVVGASCADSTRILLNSKSRQHPNGIGNSADVVGRYLCEQVMVHVRGFAPELIGEPAQNDDGISGGHLYFPRSDQQNPNNDFLRGFGIQCWNTGCQENASYAKELAGFGVDFKKNVKDRYPALVQLHPFGETLPYRRNRITVDGTANDRFGVPVMKIDYEIGENEFKMIDRMYDVVEEIMHEAKIEPLPYKRGAIDPLGSAIHEHGTCRMGEDPKTSALTKDNQMHDVKNVFVVDGSAFPSATEKNPTLTILALSWRATDYMAAEMQRGNL